VIDVYLAQQLRRAGLAWKPAAGDRFAVPDRGLDDQVFVLSDMTIEVHDLPEGQVLGFNGTTEWALDDVELDEALWLPREDQLRELLGGTFRALRRTDGKWVTEITLLGEERSFEAATVESAYAAALLHLLAAAI
jgi:hypothetical protein